MEKIKKELNKIDMGKLVSEMVQIPSYSFMENQEKEIAEFIRNYFEKEGIDCQSIEIEPGRYNTVAKIPGTGNGKSLMLSGHMDTVPPYDMKTPFEGKIENGKVFGRGACDMKGPLAAMMATMTAIKRSGVEIAGDIYFTGVADEEEQGKGVKYLIENGPYTDAVIVGEPTNMNIAPGHKGLEWIEVTFTGKKVHAGKQKEGVNAIEMAARFVEKIYTEYSHTLRSRCYPILGEPTINVGTIIGGDQPSTVPDYCSIRLDRRMVPTETIEQVYRELREIGEQLHREDPRFTCSIRDVFEGKDLLPHLPFVTNDYDPLMVSAKEACAEQGKEIVIEPFPAWTDAGFIASSTDSKCIVMGPGELRVAHSVDECIDISEVRLAAEIYASCILKYCR